LFSVFMKWVNWLVPKDISTSSSIVKKILVDIQKELNDQFSLGTYCAHRVPVAMRAKDIVYNRKNQLFTLFNDAKLYFDPKDGYFVFTKDQALYKMKVGDVFIPIDTEKYPKIIMDSPKVAWYYCWLSNIWLYTFGRRII